MWLVVVGKFDGEQAPAAREIGCDTGLFNRWLYGEGRPGLVYLDKVERVTGATSDDFRRAPQGPFPLDELEAFASEWRAARTGTGGSEDAA